MKIAVLTDAHANLPALQVALAAIRAEGCDAIYHTGDAIGIGPFPAETLDLLLSTPRMHFVMGNHDAWFAIGLPRPRPAYMSAGEWTHHEWVHAQIDPTLRPVVAQWPLYLQEKRLGAVETAFLHYRFDERGDFSAIIKEPTPDALDDLFQPYPADLLFYGHHHPAYDVTTARARYVNPGSLGCHTKPVARFAVITFDGAGGYEVTHQAVPYDERPLFAAFPERGVPDYEFICRIFFGRH